MRSRYEPTLTTKRWSTPKRRWDIYDGASVMIDGFGMAGMPDQLIDALIARGVGNLTIINNNAGNDGVTSLIKADRMKKIVRSLLRQSGSLHFDAAYRAGQIELELVPQGNLAARVHAAGASLGAIFTPTGYVTLLPEGKDYVLELSSSG